MIDKLKFAIFCVWLTIFLSQNFADVVSLVQLEQPTNHPEIPLVCAIAQCTTIFDKSAWFLKKSTATLSFSNGQKVEVPFMGIVDELHKNYYRYVTFLKLPMFIYSPAGAAFLKTYYCDPAPFVRSFLGDRVGSDERPTRVDWIYLSWDEKFRVERGVECVQ